MKNQLLHTTCLICNATKLKELERYQDSYLCKCQSCSFVFSKNIPSNSELLDFYSKSYDRTRYFSSITKKRYEKLLESFEPYRKTNKLLDVGCGYGFFLEVAKEKGWEVHGIEISKKASDECREKGINMFHGSLANSDFDSELFDVIISIEVIEHLTDPTILLKQSNAFLRKGGLMYITTPNFNSYLRYKLKEQYDVIDYPNHLCYFTAKTLRKVCESNGFKTKSIVATGISLTRAKTSKGKSNQKFVSETSDDEMLRYRIEKNRGLRFGKRIGNKVLNLLKIGESLKGTFTKI